MSRHIKPRKLKFYSTILLLIFISAINGKEKLETPSSDTPNKGVYSTISSYVKDGLSHIFKPDENPTWQKTFAKTTIGISGFMISEYVAAYNTNPHYAAYTTNNIVNWSCAALTFNALADAAYLVYDYLRSPKLAHLAFGRSKLPTVQGVKKYNELVSKSNFEVARLTRAGRCVLNSAVASYFIYKEIEELGRLYNKGINPFSLSYPEGQECTTSQFCYPIMIPTFLALFMSTLSYYIWELSHFVQPSFPDRGDIPFFEIINGFMWVGFAATIPKGHNIDLTTLDALAYPGLYDFAVKSKAHQHLTYSQLYNLFCEQHNFHQSDRMLYFFIQKAGNFKIHTSTLLALKNSGSYIWGTVTIQKRKIDNTKLAIPLPENSKKKAVNTSPHKNPPVANHLQGEPKTQQIAWSQPTQESFPKTSMTTQESSINTKGERTKTRGDSDISKSKYSIKTSKTQQQNTKQAQEDDPTLSDRKAALERLKELGKQYPIKTSDINAELSNALTFVKGHILPAGRNEFKFIWYIGNNEYSMNYETPHGYDSSNYRGNRLDRVMTLMEMCYLVGLDEEKVNEQIEKYNLYHLLRMEKFLYYVFSNRSRL
jgi:hypothetical protein